MARKSKINSALNDVIYHSVSVIDKDGEVTSISSIWNVINLHESIFLPVITGNIQVNDTINLRAKLKMKGGERIYIDFSKPTYSGKLRYTKYFTITSIDNGRPGMEGGETQTYVIRFCSEEWIASKYAASINRSFSGGAYSDYVRNVIYGLIENIKIPSGLKLKKKNLTLEQTYGPVQEHNLPGYTSFEAIEFFERRSINEIKSPFLFFENNQGFSFISISRMMDGVSVVPGGLVVSTSKNSAEQADYVPLKYNEILNFNLEKINYDAGPRLSKVASFDLLKGNIEESFASPLNDPSNLTNKDSAPNISSGDGSIILFSKKNRGSMDYNLTSFASNRIIAGQNISPYALDIGVYRENNTDEENFFLQRETLINSLSYTKFSGCEVAGNPAFTVGIPVDISVPAFTPNTELKRNMDPYLTGRYIITKVRHNLTKSTGLRTFIAVASNSPGNTLL